MASDQSAEGIAQESGLRNIACFAGCLEAGYENVAQLQQDPDLEYLRKDARFKGLLERFKLTTRKGFIGEFLKGFNL